METERSSVRRLIDESDELIARTYQLFDEIDCDTSGLPDGAASHDRPLSIVFAGQYSAGKSTIIKALTGDEAIETGQMVTTQVATEYPWHGMVIIDTPGIGTGQGACKEHDATSMEAISKADLLVYVVTSEGFDNFIAKEFRNLIIDMDKAGETILVVNKMMDCGDGNTPEQRAIIAGDLAEITAPYTPDDLHAVYIDAMAYLRSIGLAGKDPAMASILRSDSNLHDLLLALEGVACSNSVAARLTTPLYQTMGEIDKAINHLGDVGNDQTKLLRERLKEERGAIVNTRSSVLSRSLGEYTQAASEIRDEGRKLADVINECDSERVAESCIAEALQHVKKIETGCMEAIDGLLQEAADAVDSSFESLRVTLQRDLGVDVEFSQHSDGMTRVLLDHLVRDGAFEKGSSKLIALTIGDEAETGLKIYRASKAHLFFREASQKLGIKLKPWGAVKMAKGLNYLGRAVGAAGVILPALLELKDEKDAAACERIAQSNRDNVRSQFNDEARSFVRECEEGIQRFDSELLQPRLDAINNDLTILLSDEMSRSVNRASLVKLRAECSDLIRAIHLWQRNGKN